MSVEENKKSCYRCFEEIWNKRDMSVIPEVIAPDYVGHNVPQEIQGLDGFEKMVKDALDSVPDLKVSVDDVFGEGDKLAIRITNTGTATRKVGNVEPGQPVRMVTVLINRYVDGKCVESTPYAGQA